MSSTSASRERLIFRSSSSSLTTNKRLPGPPSPPPHSNYRSVTPKNVRTGAPLGQCLNTTAVESTKPASRLLLDPEPVSPPRAADVDVPPHTPSPAPAAAPPPATPEPAQTEPAEAEPQVPPQESKEATSEAALQAAAAEEVDPASPEVAEVAQGDEVAETAEATEAEAVGAVDADLSVNSESVLQGLADELNQGLSPTSPNGPIAADGFVSLASEKLEQLDKSDGTISPITASIIQAAEEGRTITDYSIAATAGYCSSPDRRLSLDMMAPDPSDLDSSMSSPYPFTGSSPMAAQLAQAAKERAAQASATPVSATAGPTTAGYLNRIQKYQFPLDMELSDVPRTNSVQSEELSEVYCAVTGNSDSPAAQRKKAIEAARQQRIEGLLMCLSAFLFAGVAYVAFNVLEPGDSSESEGTASTTISQSVKPLPKPPMMKVPEKPPHVYWWTWLFLPLDERERLASEEEERLRREAEEAAKRSWWNWLFPPAPQPAVETKPATASSPSLPTPQDASQAAPAPTDAGATQKLPAEGKDVLMDARDSPKKKRRKMMKGEPEHPSNEKSEKEKAAKATKLQPPAEKPTAKAEPKKQEESEPSKKEEVPVDPPPEEKSEKEKAREKVVKGSKIKPPPPPVVKPPPPAEKPTTKAEPRKQEETSSSFGTLLGICMVGLIAAGARFGFSNSAPADPKEPTSPDPKAKGNAHRAARAGVSFKMPTELELGHKVR
eukprot:GGOE01003086.1.p1 GENE.GGOE01003086.1~~GGOE01003086.1.p1  ORF type:complete len:813 (-),score=165.51 GGOE01003086.1:245-2410(-)